MKDMATWNYISDPMKATMVEGVKEEVKGREMDELVKWRDDKLVQLLKVIYSE